MTVVLLVAGTAHADFRFQTDATEPSDSQTDVEAITHSHGTVGGLRHTVTFDGTPTHEQVSGTSLSFRIIGRRGSVLKRRIEVESPDGVTLRGRVTSRDRTLGYVYAQMEDPSMLVLRFNLRDLHARRARSYGWHVWTVLGVAEFDDPCSGEDEGPPVCRDRAPTTGRLKHSLR